MSRNRWEACAVFIVGLLCAANSSATPGDAAARSRHPEQAARLYKIGVERNHDGEAALKLGLLLEARSISEEEWGSAGSWYLRACELNDVVGCHNAGVGFEAGTLGLAKDYESAQESYRRGAIRGYMPSQYNLGSLYANQFLSDDSEGLKWMLIAQATANACARQPSCKWVLDDPPGHRAKLMARMSSEQIQSATRQATEFRPSESEH